MAKLTHVLMGVSGSISAARVLPYIDAIQARIPCRMHLMMTPSAQNFIPASTLTHSIDGEVFTDLGARGPFKMPHVELTQWADFTVILPASAHTIAKAAHGFAPDILSATVLASERPVFFFPGMYIGMWHKKSVRRNIDFLRDEGYQVYPQGALPTPEEAIRFIREGVSL